MFNAHAVFFGSSSGWRSCAAYVVGPGGATTAVLTTPPQKRAKALFCSKAPALLRSSGDDSKAAHPRKPPLSRDYLARDVVPDDSGRAAT
ncbi:MAG TPA: hypothetical protein VNA44_12880, partial [Burkholderiaceae bacterium]|nr:hypothetical protein [Burkholderiaceae bacterium]